ncbi:MAG: hypothetical protein H0X41_06325 [Chitinophagaceae bacterium]|nr:hypothetical protein [Chitinophagaceae bacterium]
MDDMISALPPSGEQLKEGEKQWIPVSEPPEEDSQYMVTNGKYVWICGFSLRGGWINNNGQPIHWMPLPAAPSLTKDKP